MSSLTTSTKQLSNVNPMTEALQNQLVSFLGGGGLSRGLNPSVVPDAASLAPFLQLFSQQNARNLAQAKESAGNLTGSGLGNIIGAEAGRADSEQGAFLANLFEQRRQADANRFAQVLLGSLNSNAGGVTNIQQPGLLDYASQGAMALAGGGAFNGLFSPGGGGGGGGGGGSSANGSYDYRGP